MVREDLWNERPRGGPGAPPTHNTKEKVDSRQYGKEFRETEQTPLALKEECRDPRGENRQGDQVEPRNAPPAFPQVGTESSHFCANRSTTLPEEVRRAEWKSVSRERARAPAGPFR